MAENKYLFSFKNQFSKTENEKNRKFKGVGYSGDLITNHWYWSRVVFDLESTEQGTEKLPMLLEHDPKARAGFGSIDIADNQLNVSGDVFNITEAGREVIELSDAGFDWQMSVYIQPQEITEIQEGSTVFVNGRQFQGPVTVFRKNKIYEVSFCSMGADSQTSAKVFNKGDKKMKVTKKIMFCGKEVEAELVDGKYNFSVEISEGANTVDVPNQEESQALKEANDKIVKLETELAEIKKAEELKQAEAVKMSLKSKFSKAGMTVDEDLLTKYMTFSVEQVDALIKQFEDAKKITIDESLTREQASGAVIQFNKNDHKDITRAAKELVNANPTLSFEDAVKQLMK
jgi:hypothetical protein